VTDLVTGGSGFIGRHLVARLAAAGRPVRVLDPVPPPQPGSDGPAIEHAAGSVTDRAAVDAAMAGVERVFHVAGLPDLWRRDRADYARINLHGTRTVAAAARAAGVGAFVHTSTAVVLAGADPDDAAAVRAAGPYTRSKIAAEAAVAEEAARGLAATILRPGAPIGPGDDNMTPPTRLLADAVAGRLPAYLDAALCLVDVRDLAHAFAAAAERGATGTAYVVGHPPVRLSHVFASIRERPGTRPPRRRVPAALARSAAAVEEAIGRATGRPPSGSVEGVRLALRPLALAGRPDQSALGVMLRPLADSLADAVAWLQDQRP